jgi:hypothetical protein
LSAVVEVSLEPPALGVGGSTIRALEAASCSRASALASACATSSAKLATRCSVYAGKARGRPVVATIAPQSLPATVIGAATEDAIPTARILSASSPSTSA